MKQNNTIPLVRHQSVLWTRLYINKLYDIAFCLLKRLDFSLYKRNYSVPLILYASLRSYLINELETNIIWCQMVSCSKYHLINDPEIELFVRFLTGEFDLISFGMHLELRSHFAWSVKTPSNMSPSKHISLDVQVQRCALFLLKDEAAVILNKLFSEQMISVERFCSQAYLEDDALSELLQYCTSLAHLNAETNGAHPDLVEEYYSLEDLITSSSHKINLSRFILLVLNSRQGSSQKLFELMDTAVKDLGYSSPKEFVSSLTLFSDDDLYHYAKSKRVDTSYLRRYFQSSSTTTGVLFDIATTVMHLERHRPNKFSAMSWMFSDNDDELDRASQLLNRYMFVKGKNKDLGRLVSQQLHIPSTTQQLLTLLVVNENDNGRGTSVGISQRILYELENVMALFQHRMNGMRTRARSHASTNVDIVEDASYLLNLFRALQSSPMWTLFDDGDVSLVLEWISELESVDRSSAVFVAPQPRSAEGEEEVNMVSTPRSELPLETNHEQPNNISGDHVAMARQQDEDDWDEQVEFITDWQSILDNASIRAELIDMITAARAEFEMNQ